MHGFRILRYVLTECLGWAQTESLIVQLNANFVLEVILLLGAMHGGLYTTGTIDDGAGA